MGEVKDFLTAISRNPEARKLIREAKEPANMEETARLYAEIAAKTGISVTQETIQKFLEGKEKIQKAMTAKAESTVKEALTEDALDSVAGGLEIDNCESTANLGEWCWFSDSCNYVINSYDCISISEKTVYVSEPEYDFDPDDPKFWDDFNPI